MSGRAFISLWSQPQIDFERQMRTAGSSLDHSASEQYLREGVGRGDSIYVIGTTAKPHRMILVGKLITSRGVLTQAQAEAEFGHAVYGASDHVIGTGSVVDFDRVVPERTVRAITRATGTPIKMTSATEYEIDSQTLRRCGEITDESAALLDALL